MWNSDLSAQIETKDLSAKLFVFNYLPSLDFLHS